jgi:mycofactocin system glycosyltransferase
MRFRTDGTWNRTGISGRVVLAGSPLRVFRLTAAGTAVCAAVESGDEVAESSLVERLLDAGAIHPRPTATERTGTRQDVTVITPQLGGTARADRDVTVDDGSNPRVDGATVRLDRNRGPGAARNVGRRHAATPLLAFVDADVSLPDPDWLDRLLPHFDDPRVGLVAPRVVGDPNASLDLGGEPARIIAGSRVSYVPGAAIVVRASAFDDIGGFDEHLRFGEDVDFVWRLDQAGWRCRYEPGVRVRHAPRAGWAARLAQQVGYGSAAAPLAQRHPRLLSPLRVNGWMAAAWTALGTGHPASACVMAMANAVSVTRSLPDVPTADVVRLTATSYVSSGRQVAATIRRVWWPLALAACAVSRRARWVAAASIAVDPRAAPTDMAYGWGVWREMIRRRTWEPAIPEISSWPPMRRHRSAAAVGAGQDAGVDAIRAR